MVRPCPPLWAFPEQPHAQDSTHVASQPVALVQGPVPRRAVCYDWECLPLTGCQTRHA